MVRREDLIPGETKRIISWDDVKRDFSGFEFFPNICYSVSGIRVHTYKRIRNV